MMGNRSFILLIATFALIACGGPSVNNEVQPSANAKSPFHDEIMARLGEMSLEEKVGEMTQLNLDVVSVGEIYNLKEPHALDSAKLYHAIVERHVGSLLNVGGHAYPLAHWQEMIKQIQDLAMTKGNGIPVLYGIDAIHGANYLAEGTLLPQPLAQAATFNLDLVEMGARVTAYETRATGVPWNFSPVLDVARQPLWSRFFETYGEDVYLAQKMGAATIKGYQGSDALDHTEVAATMKHFLGYSMPFSGKDRTPVYIDERQLREIFLPTFEEAIRVGALTVMINSGELNGIPVHADKAILTDLLRTELGFQGLAVTDWEDIMKLVNFHRVAPNIKEAVRMSVMAGIDMAMVPNDYSFTDALIELAKEGSVPEERINEAVYRILHVKNSLNLFEEPFSPATHDYPLVASDSFNKLNLETARQAITLLKNKEGILPLKSTDNIVLVGNQANDNRYMNGAWSRTWQGMDEKWDVEPNQKSLATAMKEKFSTCNYILEEEVSKNASSLRSADKIVWVLAEKPSTEKPGDIDDLNYDARMHQLAKELASFNKPIVLVLLQNRPRIITEFDRLSEAVVLAYELGAQGGTAISEMLLGEFSPSGRLPFTYPKNANDLLTYDHKFTEKLDQQFGMNAFDPLYEFGFGLSYSSFQYTLATVANELVGKDSLKIQYTIQNTGKLASYESSLLFVSDSVASITPPVKRLRKFDKVWLEAGESKEANFYLKASDLAFISSDNNWVTEEGWFTVRLADQKVTFYYKP
jgi:beta-glucosidase